MLIRQLLRRFRRYYFFLFTPVAIFLCVLASWFSAGRAPVEDLDDLGIAYCGRYGDWGYMWTDESFISGERAAETALSKCAV